MPNTKSAIKRMKTENKSYLVNRQHKARLKTWFRKFSDSIERQDLQQAQAYQLILQSMLDSSARHGYMHINKASRLVSRINAKVKLLCLK